MKLLKDKSLGGYLLLAATALALVTAVIYAVFGAASGTFAAGILLCVLAAAVLGCVTLVKENFLSDYFSIAMTVVLSVGLALFIRNSVGDFTELLTPVGMYGNPDNMPMRFVISGLILVSIVLSIAEGFKKRVK